MRDTPLSPHAAVLAQAQSWLPAQAAELYQAAPYIVGWTPEGAVLYLQITPQGLQLWQRQSATGSAQLLRASVGVEEERQWGALWEAHWQSLSALQKLRLRSHLAADGIYLHSLNSAWHVPLHGACAMPVQALPQRLPAHGFALQALEPSQQLLSPDGRYLLVQEQDNLLLHDMQQNSQHFLSCDGRPGNAWGCPMYFGLQIDEADKIARPLVAAWSPCSRYVLSYRLDLRNCHQRQMLRSRADGSEQLLAWPEVMTGQEFVPEAHLCLFDVVNRRALPLLGPQFLMFDADYCTQFFLQQLYWDEDALYLLPWGRGRKSVELYRTDLTSGATHLLFSESAETLLDYPLFPGKCLCVGERVFWISERSGWAHIYQLRSGELQPLTSGEWAVRALLGADANYLYFTAGGREAGLDPYWQQVYRLELASGNLTRLSHGDADHQVWLAPDCQQFVLSQARHDLPPQVSLHAHDGSLLAQLGAADCSAFLAKGWQNLQAVQAWARDGKTRLHGLLAVPAQAAQAEVGSVPLVISIYPGCHTSTVPKRLELPDNHMFFMQALASLGFFVLRVDSMGGPGRSKAFHDVCYRNLGDAGLPDQVAFFKQIAEQYPQIDLQRVAMIGSSAGGYATARAMFCYPEVFKLGVAAAGNHVLLAEGAEWTEDYGGWPIDHELLQAHSNPPLAAQLQGKLLLVHGELDDNVSVAQSLRLAQALLAADRPFDMLIVPNADHAALMSPTVTRHVMQYLLQHL